jgi:hypothetical protein
VNRRAENKTRLTARQERRRLSFLMAISLEFINQMQKGSFYIRKGEAAGANGVLKLPICVKRKC